MAARKSLISSNLDDLFNSIYFGHTDLSAEGMGSAIAVQFRNAHGHTLIHQAVQDNNIKKIRKFVVLGMSPNAINRDGDTPLHLAIRNSSRPVVEELLSMGADMDAVSQTCMGQSLSALQLAVLYDQMEVVKLLLAAGADKERPSALHTAIIEENIEMVELLLSMGCDINNRGPNGMSPISHAVLQQDLEMVAVILKHSPTLSEGPYHLPLLSLAAQAPSPVRNELFRMLLSQGADPNACSSMKAMTGAAIPGSCLVPSCSNADNSRLNCLRWLLEYNCEVHWEPGKHRHWEDTPNNMDNMHDSTLYFALKRHNDLETVMLFQAGLDHTRLRWPTKHWLKLRRDEPTKLGRFLRKHTDSPCPLLELCRNTIRENLGWGIHKKIKTLSLPSPLMKYVLLVGVFDP